MKIEISTIDKMAHLARLELKISEKEQMAKDFEQILDWMNQLNEINTDNVEPLTHMNSNINVFREDIAQNNLSKEQGLFNAPQKNKDYFMVPKVIE